ncbi:hypothetical protein [Halorubrum tropicale]|uniref:Uncharacterized protein n=1 Tax=Halorubrum tropicale TaxID=1765655 RepID=A0A0M9AKF5_9EURY|nr:hypothetical protein [Halorubrum tropicale]KOX93268.1 hypothetical protein AMR74_16645 [Halorubrum tropicale]
MSLLTTSVFGVLPSIRTMMKWAAIIFAAHFASAAFRYVALATRSVDPAVLDPSGVVAVAYVSGYAQALLFMSLLYYLPEAASGWATLVRDHAVAPLKRRVS